MEKRFTVQQQFGMVLAVGFAAGAIFANFPGKDYVGEMGILSSAYREYLLAGGVSGIFEFLMTLILIYDALEEGRVRKEDLVRVSDYAASWEAARGTSEFGLVNTNKLMKQYSCATGTRPAPRACPILRLRHSPERRA